METRWITVALTGLIALSACTTAGGSTGSSASPTPSPSETVRTPAPRVDRDSVRFVLRKKYEPGGEVAVKLRNDDDRAYRYNSTQYEACVMTFRDASGRKFLIPEGTHCDLIAYSWLEPGQTVTLFSWDLDECLKDEWGCTKERDLRPGKYTMTDRLRPKGGGERVEVVGRIRIVKAH